MSIIRSSDKYDFIYSLIGEQVRFHRTRKRMNQEELADAVGLKRTSIVNLEAGKQRIPLHALYTIAEVLDAPISEFISDKGGEYRRVREAALAKLTDEEKAALGLPLSSA